MKCFKVLGKKLNGWSLTDTLFTIIIIGLLILVGLKIYQQIYYPGRGLFFD